MPGCRSSRAGAAIASAASSRSATPVRDAHLRNGVSLGGDRRRELRGLAQHHVRLPLLDRLLERREHRIDVQRREDLADDDEIALSRGQRGHPSPDRPEDLLRRRRPGLELVAPALSVGGPTMSVSCPSRTAASMNGISGPKWPAPCVDAKRTRTRATLVDRASASSFEQAMSQKRQPGCQTPCAASATSRTGGRSRSATRCG